MVALTYRAGAVRWLPTYRHGHERYQSATAPSPRLLSRLGDSSSLDFQVPLHRAYIKLLSRLHFADVTNAQAYANAVLKLVRSHLIVNLRRPIQTS